MNFDMKKFKSDESRSNPMAVAFVYPECPIDRPCFWIVAGPGTPINVCEHFRDQGDGERADCVFTEMEGR